jgi:SynChlorMet cassette protein ScmC
MIRQLNGKEKIYRLPLADGTTWGLSATKSLEPWLDELAAIMQLETTSENVIDRKVFFLALNKANQQPSSCQDWEYMKQGSVYRIWSHSTIPETFIELNRELIDHPEVKIINMWSSLKVIYKYYVEHSIGPVHAALANIANKGILIAAAGGTGKSTCSRRLPTPWQALSDDNALIVKNQLNNAFHVHPMPTWSDHLQGEKFSSFNTSYSVPLKAIFFLEQSAQDKVTPMIKTIATHKIFVCFKQVWENYMTRLSKPEKTAMSQQLFNNACELTENIPCYTLEATLDGQFWKDIEKVLNYTCLRAHAKINW